VQGPERHLRLDHPVRHHHGGSPGARPHALTIAIADRETNRIAHRPPYGNTDRPSDSDTDPPSDINTERSPDSHGHLTPHVCTDRAANPTVDGNWFARLDTNANSIGRAERIAEPDDSYREGFALERHRPRFANAAGKF
jgi:hypothetical protein